MQLFVNPNFLSTWLGKGNRSALIAEGRWRHIPRMSAGQSWVLNRTRRHHNAWTPRIRMFADLCSTALTCLPWGRRHRRSNLEMTKPLSHHRKQFGIVLFDLACEEVSPHKLYISVLIILITYHSKRQSFYRFEFVHVTH